MLTGQNGILTQAQNASTQTEIAEAKEQARLDIMAWQSSKIEEGEDTSLNDEIIKTILEGKDYVESTGETSFISREGNHEILYSELYVSAGKEISDLYDGFNDPKDTENYNEDAMHIGDYVNYTAGNWEETVEMPTAENPFTFGGYTSGQSRDTNGKIKNHYEPGYIEGKYSGWRIWDISEDKKTLTLISAGCPEAYYSPDSENAGYISEYILTGDVKDDIDENSLGLGSTYIARDYSMYKNQELYAENARGLKKSEADEWYNKYIDSSIDDLWNATFPLNTENKLISVMENSLNYWIPECMGYAKQGLYFLDTEYRILNDNSDDTMGIRVLVSLSSDVRFNETPEKIEQDGFTYNKWIIKTNNN